MLIPSENVTGLLREFHGQSPKKISDKDTASGLRAKVFNQEFGRRQRDNAFSDF
jgi:hypothetical protein